MTEKNYLKCRAKEVGKFGAISFSVKGEDLQAMMNDKGYINIIICKRKEADKYKNTHYAYENDWKPDGQKKDNSGDSFENTPHEDIPF